MTDYSHICEVQEKRERDKSFSPSFTLNIHDIDAVLFDLDGVVTETADLHATAWKEMFDSYLKQRAARDPQSFRPFDIESDYRKYVDGKPRNTGVASFLQSRGIELPCGTPHDSPGQETIWGLGNKKNEIFQQLLTTQGAQVFATTVTFIRNLKAHGIKIAVVSSSKNCSAILQSAGLSALFDTQVDGVESARLQLTGKPAPDIFLQAATQLDVAPAHAVVVEDAIAGVEAGQNGNFGLVIGVARQGNQRALKEHGADVVVEDLGEIHIDEAGMIAVRHTQQLPSALDSRAEIIQCLQRQRPVVFLDYDGTLAPIVERPDQAVLAEDMRRVVKQLAQYCPVAIISGRDRADVQRLVQLDTVFYAGSHGFDIAGPQGMQIQHEQGVDFLPEIDQVDEELRQKLAPIDGALVERKKFSVAVHFRCVAPEEEGRVADVINEVLADHPKLRKGLGKKVFELQPRIEWHKGKAVLWLLEALKLDTTDVVPLYIGDDITDEDAFAALADCGISIAVEEAPRPTAAQYVLKNPSEVKQFLQYLLTLLKK